jgi:hypothetical protein
MMLGLAIAEIPQFVGLADVTAHLLEDALVEVVALPGHAGFDLMAPADNACLHEVELHELGLPWRQIINADVDKDANWALSMRIPAIGPLLSTPTLTDWGEFAS